MRPSQGQRPGNKEVALIYDKIQSVYEPAPRHAIRVAVPPVERTLERERGGADVLMDDWITLTNSTENTEYEELEEIFGMDTPYL